MDEEILKLQKYVKNDVPVKNKAIGGVLAFLFGQLGIHRLYMNKKGWLWCLVLTMFSFGFLYFFFIAEGIVIIAMSNKKFQMICQSSSAKLERKILMTKYEDLDKLASDLGMILPKEIYYANESQNVEETLDKIFQVKNTNDTVAHNYEKVGAIDSDEHEHIKEDETLANKIDMAQDRLERYQNNDYYPTANKVLSSKEIAEKRKELKADLKAGLISKEDYQEEIIKLDLLI